jgi:hypothetical protein
MFHGRTKAERDDVSHHTKVEIPRFKGIPK